MAASCQRDDVDFRASTAPEERGAEVRLRRCPLSHVLIRHRVQIGSVFIHLAVNGSTPQLRRDTLSALERLSTSLPEAVNRVARDALVAFISKDDLKKAKVANGDDAHEDRAPANRQMRLSNLLYTCAAFGDAADPGLKQRLLADLVVVAHHAGVCRLLFCFGGGLSSAHTTI